MNIKLYFRNKTFYKFALLFVFSLLLLMFVLPDNSNAIVNNSSGIPGARRSWSITSWSTPGNNACFGPGGVFPYQFQTWWSRRGNSITEIRNNGVVTVPNGTNSVALQLNMLGNHCISNMVDSTGAARPGFTSQLLTPIPSNFIQVSRFNLSGATDSHPSLTTTGEADTTKDIRWNTTYGPSYGSYANLFYVPPIDYDVTISGFNSLPPGDHLVSVFVNSRAVSSFGTSTSNIVSNRCVSAPRQSTNGLSGTSPLCNSGGYQVFMVFRKAPPTTTTIPGCTDPAASNYNPSATVDDGSCVYAPPPPPSPTCNLGNSVISSGFRLSFNSTNATSASINQGVGGVPVNGTRDVGTAGRTYTMTVNGPGGSGRCTTTTIPPPAPVCNSFTFGVSGNNYRLTWNTTNATSVSISNIGGVPVDGNRDVPQIGRTYTLTARNIHNVTDTCSVTTPPPPSCNLVIDVAGGSYRVVWTSSNAVSITIDQGVGSVSPVASGNRNVNLPVGTTTFTATVANAPGATRTCQAARTVDPPTCSAVRFYRSGNQSPPQQILAGSRFRTEVEVNNPNPVALGINTTNYNFSPAVSGDNVSNTYNSVPSIPANGSRSYHSSNANWNDELIRLNVPGTYNGNWTVSYNGGSLPCSDTVEIEVLPLTCIVNTLTNSIGFQFSVSVRLENPNYIPITVSRSEWDVPVATPDEGFGNTDSSGRNLNGIGGGSIIPAGSEIVPTNLTIESANNLVITNSGIYAVSWDVDSQYGTDPANCGRNDSVTAQQQPYTRFYGNDVFAGGAEGNCTVSGSADVEGYGGFRGANDHSGYIGSAAQLAIFATGNISGVLPGSQFAGRTGLDALSFANTTNTGSGSLTDLGGDFAMPLCSDDFLNNVDRSGFQSSGGGNLNLGGNNSRDYARSGTAILRNGDNIPNGKRVQVYVEGDVVITDNIIYAEANNSTWTSIANIPLVRVYATGNIYIDYRVTEISGLYVAGNTIYTCSNGGNPYTNVNINSIASNCNSKLTVYGAFVAENVVLHRVQGSYGLTGAIPEPFDSANIAESFIFSPELYLALLSEGTSNTTAKFDSILSLPPAF